MIETQPIENLDRTTLRLVRLALRARKKAYAPYSKFQVGCALVDSRGKVHTGCNVENASFSATICAERAAVVKMVSRGRKEIRRLVVVTSSEEPLFPCGVCLQVLQEMGPNAEVIAVNGRGTVFRNAKVHTLFPNAFSKEHLSS